MATGAGKTRTVIALVDLLMRAELGEARAVPRRPRRARESGGRRLQDASAGRRARQSRHRAHERGPRLRLDLSDDDEPDRRQAGRQGEVRPRPFRPRRDRRGASLGLPEVPRDLRVLRLAFSSGSPRRPRTRSTRTPIRSSTSRTACRPTPIRSTRRSPTGYLVPPKAISVPLKFLRAGLRYDDLSDEEKDQWDMLEWGEEEIPDSVEAAGVEQVAVQRGHGRSRHRASDGERPQGRGRRPARQDDHLRQEPGACGVHRRALQRQLPQSRRTFRPRDHL